MYTYQDILKSIIDNNNDLVFALDTEKKYLLFNSVHQEVMKRMYGVDIKEGVCILDYVKGDESFSVCDDVFSKVLNGESVNLVAEFDCKMFFDGFTALQVSPLKDKQSNICGITVCARNISKEKDLERENSHYISKMDTIVSELSHKLRRPVATILGLVQFIDNAESNTDISEIIQYLKESTDELDEYIREMTSRLEEKTIS